MKRNYSNWSKEELVRELEKIGKRKKYGVVWENKTEEVVELCKVKLPVLEENKQNEVQTDKNNSVVNILIEGDNYHALSVLNYTHKGAVDVIYIDPPYNTGSDDFKFNDRIVDLEDNYRHSKWLSFMEKRLRLARNLLRPDGILYVSIGSDELAQLKLLSDEIFNELNLVEIISRVAKTASNKGTQFSPSVDYILCYTKNIKKLGKFKDILTDDWIKLFNKEDSRGKHREISLYQAALDVRPNQNYFIICPDGSKARPPVGKVYRWTEKTLLENLKNDLVVFKKAKNSPLLDEKGQKSIWNIYTKTYLSDREEEGKRPRNFLNEFINRGGADLLREMDIDFSYSKPVNLVKHLIQITNKSNDITVLDFFAGSGTAGHAVLEMNSDDDGSRNFILCTNNEGNGLKIAVDVCYPRIKKAIKGYKNTRGESVKGLGGNLKYYITDFVDAESTDKNKRKLVDKSTEMLCLKEDCFDELIKGQSFRMFTNGRDKHLGIIYDDDGIEPLKKEVKKLNQKFVVYVFSLDDSAREEEFEDVAGLVELRPIPAVILNVYRRIFK